MVDTKDPAPPEVVKDPTQKIFWRPRNILLLVITASAPALCGWAWNRGSTAIENYFAKQRAQDERIKALEEDTRERLKELENDQANNKAIWDAITEERNKITEQEIEIRVLQRIVDHELRRSIVTSARSKEPSTTPGETPADLNPPAPVIPPPPKPAPKVDPDLYRLERESKFPKPAPNQQKK